MQSQISMLVAEKKKLEDKVVKLQKKIDEKVAGKSVPMTSDEKDKEILRLT